MAENFDYLTLSSDYKAMAPYWSMVGTLLEGASAVREEKTFLPQFPNEGNTNYDYRRKNAKFTNIYRDVVENLAAKPSPRRCASLTILSLTRSGQSLRMWMVPVITCMLRNKLLLQRRLGRDHMASGRLSVHAGGCHACR